MTAKWLAEVTEEVQSANSGTFRHTLPDAGALHALMIKVKATNGSTSGRNVTILDVVDEIRVKSNKQDPIFSLSSQELEKWYELFYGSALPAVYDEQADAVQEFVFPVWFGREQYDDEFFLRLEDHRNVELEIDYSPNIAADAGFATGTVTFDVKALVTPNSANLPYQGCMTIRRLKTATSAASGEVDADMPGSAVMRAIGVYVYEAGVADDTNVTKIVVRNRRDSSNLLEMGWDDFIHLNFVNWGGILERVITLFGQNNDTVNTRIGEILANFVAARVAVDTTNDVIIHDVVDAIAGDQLTLDCGSVKVTAGAETITAYATDHIIDCLVKGKFPSYFGIMPFRYPDDVSGYWDENAEGGLKVILTQGNAGATIKWSVQEVVTFS